MKLKYVSLAVICASAFALGACTDTQLAAFNNRVTNFVAAVHTVDEALKSVNATLYSNCASYQAIATSINDVAGNCSKAAPYTSVANSVIDNYCQSNAVAANGGISTSIAVTARSISAAKSTLAQNKAMCGG